MLYIKLPFPVILHSQISAISKQLGVDRDDLEKLLSCSRYAMLIDGEFRFVTEKDLFGLNIKPGDVMDRTGANGCLFIAMSKGILIPHLTEISIPGDVWVNTRHEWDHICNLFYFIENRVEKYNLLVNLSAPDIILRNSMRLVYESVSSLDDSSWQKVTWMDGERCLSLKDVGWSLIKGCWMDWKQRKIDERDAAFDVEWSFEEGSDG